MFFHDVCNLAGVSDCGRSIQTAFSLYEKLQKPESFANEEYFLIIENYFRIQNLDKSYFVKFQICKKRKTIKFYKSF